jgi:hypothetical protein
VVSKFYGSYLGFLNFDGVRYWDFRYIEAIRIKLEEKPLLSDFRNRADLQLLKEGKIQEAQVEKERIEEMQRKDTKLRQEYKNK